MARRPRTDPRKLPRQERSRVTVDALLTAAAHILVESGYERASVNRIARRAGVSIGSLYQYFPTKDALVAAVIRRHSGQMIASFEKDLADAATLPLHLAVREVVRRAFTAYAVDPRLRKVIVTEVPRVETFLESREFDERILLILRGYFAFHAALMRPTNHELAARIVLCAVEAVVQRFALDHPEALGSDELVDEVSALVLGYLVNATEAPGYGPAAKSTVL
jgi:AcrR family transcriptional regulator